MTIQVPNVNLNANAYNKSDIAYLEIHQFKEQLNDSIFIAQIDISYKGSFVFALETLKRLAFEAANHTSYLPADFRYEFSAANCFDGELITQSGQCVMIIRVRDTLNYDTTPTKDCNRIMTIEVFGPMKLVANFAERIDSEFSQLKLAKIFWYYLSEGQARQRTIMLEEPKIIHDEFYPWMTEGVAAYQKKYLASESSILMLLGPPGTGKTSFTRKMVYDNKLTAILTFDQAILAMDDFFMNFLMNDEQNMMIIEDADLIITSREDHGNKLMSRILNISDGLIKDTSKKIVFSANLTKNDDIDSALIRPGRCHDVLDFRKLTPEEAQTLATKAGITHKLTERKDYTLAEIYEPEHHVDRVVKEKRRIGFY